MALHTNSNFIMEANTVNPDQGVVLNKVSCILYSYCLQYSKTCLKRPLKKGPKFALDRSSLNACQKYCRMLLESILQYLEHSTILSTFIKLQFVIKTFVLSIFEWPFRTGFTLYATRLHKQTREQA